MINESNSSTQRRSAKIVVAAGLAFALLLSSLLGPAVRAQQAAAPAPAAAQIEFFEKSVRPVLAQRCYNCHGASLQSGGIRLDTQSALLLPGASGRKPIIPDQPAQSAMIQAIRYDGPIKMPPEGKLPARDIEALTQWVRMGAPWPETVTAEHHEGDAALLEAARRHWALRPVVRPAPPIVKGSAWVHNPIDAFIAAVQEAKGLTPAPPADRRTLLRRVTYDLTGLPPTSAETEAFLNDHSTTAYEKVVNRLLASPHYGERWGRFWLDIARYAETRGTPGIGLQGDETRYPFAYTYRDWVVRSLNEDLPYDKFLLYQIAADRLNLGDDHRPLAALGFLTLGPRSVNGEPDIVDDRIDVVMRGTQGLTVTCARCHDHKFDPIPTQDYYSLYGVFASSTEKTVPLLTGTGAREAMARFDAEKRERENKITAYLESRQAAIRAHTRAHYADYLLAASDPIQNISGGEETVSGLKTALIARWREAVTRARGAPDPVLGPWAALATLPYAQFASKAPAIASRLARGSGTAKSANPLVARALAGPPPASLQAAAARFARVFAAVDQRWERALASAKARGAAAPTALPDAADEQVRQVLYGSNGLNAVSSEETESLLNDSERAHLQSLRRAITQLMAAPSAPPHALVLEDVQVRENPRVFVRGNAETPGEAVPRRFLLCLAGETRTPFSNGSGRLDLANQIIRPDNPLTARVIVNRVWQGHFGQGIVRTPSDFGTRGEPPTYPELLDWLAATFVQDGWSLKRLHRLMVLSSAYQQSDEDNPENRQLDPDNRLVWRMNRRRLDFEEMRDSLLMAAGDMNLAVGGRSVEITRAPFVRRRTLYGFIDRSNLPSLYRIFDFANPDAHTAERFVTTSPQQSLFLLNSGFVVDQARRLADRPEISGLSDVRARIAALYNLVYNRPPTEHEVEIGQRFIQTAISRPRISKEARKSPWRYGYGEVDEASKRVKLFVPLPYWTGDSWQIGMFLPDPDLGGLSLSASGGAPGSDLQHAVIRRWVAPRGGVISITGQAKHLSINGDGIRVRILSSRSGELGSWRVRYTFRDTDVSRVSVKAGDTIDFAVDCGSDDIEDQFLWAPIVTLTSGDSASGIARKSRFREAAIRWSAQDDFGGPSEESAQPLSAWEKYAQILLLSNEFAFVD